MDDASRMRRGRLVLAVVCVVIGLCLIGGQLAINHVTASGRPRALWRASLPGLDIGLDAWPAAPGLGGYIELWYEGHDAGDERPFQRLPGAPAVPPTPRPGEVWTLSTLESSASAVGSCSTRWGAPSVGRETEAE